MSRARFPAETLMHSKHRAVWILELWTSDLYTCNRRCTGGTRVTAKTNIARVAYVIVVGRGGNWTSKNDFVFQLHILPGNLCCILKERTPILGDGLKRFSSVSGDGRRNEIQIVYRFLNRYGFVYRTSPKRTNGFTTWCTMIGGAEVLKIAVKYTECLNTVIETLNAYSWECVYF